jgi:diadenosine tetraphosphate (Ap4A) HIT family hydrolase
MVSRISPARSYRRGSSLTCRLCVHLPDETDLAATFFEAPTRVKSRHFVVVPDLAPLASGHVLIATLQHYLSVGHLESHEKVVELTHILDVVRAKYEARGQHVLAFEHGPMIPGGAGSCIDHLHVHVLPVKREISIVEATSSPFFRHVDLVDWRRLDDLSSLRSLQRYASYLWIQDTTGDFFVTVAGSGGGVPPQALRRWCAEILMLDAWDWRIELARRSASTH